MRLLAILPLVAVLLAPAGAACTEPPGVPRSLTVTQTGEELLRLPAGYEPARCGPYAPVAPPFDGRFVVWQGRTYDIDTRTTIALPGTTVNYPALAHGRLSVLEETRTLRVHDLANGTSVVPDSGEVFTRIDPGVAWGVDGAGEAGLVRFVAYDTVQQAWIARGTFAELGFPAQGQSPAFQAGSARWLVFLDGAGDLHVRDVVAATLLGPFEIPAGARAIAVQGDVVVLQRDEPDPSPSYSMYTTRAAYSGLRLPDGASVPAAPTSPPWEVDGRRLAYVSGGTAGPRAWTPEPLESSSPSPEAESSGSAPPSPGPSDGPHIPVDGTPTAAATGAGGGRDAALPALLVLAAVALAAVRRRL